MVESDIGYDHFFSSHQSMSRNYKLAHEDPVYAQTNGSFILKEHGDNHSGDAKYKTDHHGYGYADPLFFFC